MTTLHSLAPLGRSELDRRRFIQGALAVGGTTALLPAWLADMASAEPLGPNERILVVLLMAGGNDGIDTVGPFATGAYQDARGQIALNPAAAHPIGGGYYLNPNLSYLKTRWDAGQLAIVQGVGHSADDHSHFSSMARWMAGTASSAPSTSGWVGRYLDGTSLNGMGGVSIGNRGLPLHFAGTTGKAIVLPSEGPLFGAASDAWERAGFDCLQNINASPNNKGPMADAVAASLDTAVASAQLLDPMYGDGLSDNDVVHDMQLAARIINLDVGARVVGVHMGGFDTHDDHARSHAALMADLNAAVSGFFAALAPHFADRVAIMTMSEFGRRVEANGSYGIDHGTASVSLVVGNAVVGGTYGEYPSLSQLDNRGDLHHSVDFRSVYASVLDGWLGADSAQVIGGTYETFSLFGTAGSGPPGSGGGGGGGGGTGGGTGLLRALVPARVLDTREGLGVRVGPVVGQESVDVVVAGRGGVPSSGVGSVVLNVTGVGASAKSFVTVWPTGVARPDTANLNLTPGMTTPNLVVAKVGDGGKVSLFNNTGSTHLVADVFGWFPTEGFGALVPARVLDTREGLGVRVGPVVGQESVDVVVAGRGGVPSSGVGSVVLNVTGVGASAKSFVTVWPTGVARPDTANLNLTPGMTTPNLVVAKVGDGGKVSLFNNTGSTHLVADVFGWFPTEGFGALVPARVLDTREGLGVRVGPVVGQESVDVVVAGRGGVPSSGVGSVVLNVTGVGASAKSFVTVWPTGVARPDTANLNLTPGMTTPNLVVAKVGDGGKVSLFNNTGSTHLVADVFGWFA